MIESSLHQDILLVQLVFQLIDIFFILHCYYLNFLILWACLTFIYNLLLWSNRLQLLLLIWWCIIFHLNLVRNIYWDTAWIHNKLCPIMKKHNTMLFLQFHQILLEKQCGDSVLTIFFIHDVCTNGLQSSISIIKINWFVIYQGKLQSFSISII